VLREALQRSVRARRGMVQARGCTSQGGEPPRRSGGTAWAARSRAIGKALHPFDDESLDPASDGPGIVADQLSDRDRRVTGCGKQDHEGPDRPPPVTDFGFELAPFEC